MKAKVLYCISIVFQVSQHVPILARIVDLATSSLAGLVRGFSGVWVADGVEKAKRPQKPLRIYEFEGCPFCRKVRETLSVLDLDVEVRPCPKPTLKGSEPDKSRFRPEVTSLGGKLSFPFLVDDNTGVKMNESDAINEYLWKTYGAGCTPPLSYRIGLKLQFMPLMMVPLLFRPLPSHGTLRVSSKGPEKPLELWGCEASPFVRIVREALCVLELPYTYRTVAHGSSTKRVEWREKYGKMLSLVRQNAGSTVVQMPFLRDPNTQAELLESAEIVKYLYATYQDGPAPTETWLDLKMADKTAAVKQD